jgi:hypothetical protein
MSNVPTWGDLDLKQARSIRHFEERKLESNRGSKVLGEENSEKIKEPCVKLSHGCG